MEQQLRLAKQLMHLQRVMFDGIFNGMIIFCDQTEKMMAQIVDQAVWVPPEGKSVLKEWFGRNKKGCESFRNAANDGFTWLEGFLTAGSKTE